MKTLTLANTRGFTLIELIIVMIIIFILAAIAFSACDHTSTTGDSQVEVIQ